MEPFPEDVDHHNISLLTFFEYGDEILLYIYYFSDEGTEWEALHFNYLKKGEKNNIDKDIIMEEGDNQFQDIDAINAYKINKFGNNKVIIFARNEINIINILNMQKILIIEVAGFINNSYCTNDSFVLLFIRDLNNDGTNMAIYKINDNYSQIVLNDKLGKGHDDKYLYSLANNLNNGKFIFFDRHKFFFYELIFNSEKTINFRIDKKMKIQKKKEVKMKNLMNLKMKMKKKIKGNLTNLKIKVNINKE